MRSHLHLVLFGLTTLLSGCPSKGATGLTKKDVPPPAPGVTLLVFAPDPSTMASFGIVQDRREIQLPSGRSDVVVDGVPASVVGGSATFRSFSDPDGARVIGQTIDQAPLDGYGFLADAVGTPVTVTLSGGEVVEGTLASSDAGGGVTIDLGGGTYKTIPAGMMVSLGFASPQVAPRATGELTWSVEADRAARHLVEVTYRVLDLSWHAEHEIVLGGLGGATLADGTATLSTWITVHNSSGRDFDHVTLTLIDEDIQHAVPPTTTPYYGGYYDSYYQPQPQPATPTPPESSYLTFTAADMVAIPDGRSTQVRYAEPQPLAARRRFRYAPYDETILQLMTLYYTPTYYDGYSMKTPSAAVTEELVLGPLEQSVPAGTARLYHAGDPESGSGSVLFGEVTMPSLAAGEEIAIPIADAADLRGSREQIGFSPHSDGRRLREAFKLTVKNDSKQEIEVAVVEYLYRSANWKIVRETASHEKTGDRAVTFTMRVGPEKSESIEYAVEYSW